MLSTIMTISPAMYAALAKMEHPAGLLPHPPLALPARGMEAAMLAFINAGIEFQQSSQSSKQTYVSILQEAFNQASTADKSTSLVWDPSWLGMCKHLHPCSCRRQCRRRVIVSHAQVKAQLP